MGKKNTIHVRQLKSGTGYPKNQKATLIGLGLRRLNHLVEIEDTPSVRGMVDKVRHLVRIESGE